MKPLVSILLPVHNNASTLLPAVRSIVLQTFDDWELIVIDDASSDDSAQIPTRFNDRRISVIRNVTNRGLASCLNEGIERSRGPFIARMDGDDVSYPQRIERQVCFLASNREVDLVATRAVVFRHEGEAIGTTAAPGDHAAVCRRPWNGFNSLPHPTWLGRRAWFAANRYDTNFRKAQDRELLLRTYKTSTFGCLPEFLLGYRRDSLSLRKSFVSRCFVARALVQCLAVRRNYALAAGVPAEALKMAADVFAVASGFHIKASAGRSTFLASDELERWQTVWESCSNPESRLGGRSRAIRHIRVA
jgi:glycosyltransferase involved in cell wall biosynthesis